MFACRSADQLDLAVLRYERGNLLADGTIAGTCLPLGTIAGTCWPDGTIAGTGRDFGRLNRVTVGGSNKLLSIKETAEYLSISERTLRNHFRTWGIPAHKVGRAIRFRMRDIESFLERNKT
jgi:excisionase family DNA binding protein